MKKIVFFSLVAVTSFSVSAQKIKIKETREDIGGGSHNAITVNLYEINPSDAVDAFRSFIKKFDGKRSSQDGGVFSDNATVKDLGNNTVDIYGKAQGKKGDKEITFVVAFDLGGAFLNSSDHKDQYRAAEKIVKEFAVNTCKEIIEQQIKDAQKAESKLEDAQQDLEKENKNLNSDIEDYKAKIEDNKAKIKKAEDDIVLNKSNQDKKKAEIELQKKAVEEIGKKLKAVD